MDKIYIVVRCHEMSDDIDDWINIEAIYDNGSEADDYASACAEDEGFGLEGNIIYETYYNCYHFKCEDQDEDWENDAYYYKYFELDLQDNYKQLYNDPNQLELFVGATLAVARNEATT